MNVPLHPVFHSVPARARLHLAGMVRLCRFIFLIVLLSRGVSLCSAASAEDNAFKIASEKFNKGFWEFAASDFAAFVTNFPASFRVPDAILFQSEAVMNNGDFNRGIQLLTTNQFRAGTLGDAFLYWIGQGHLGNTNYAEAARCFGKLTKDFPASNYRLEAAVNEAAAYGKMENWPRVADLLSNTNETFQQISATVTNDLTARGYLLLGEANLARKNFDAARETVRLLGQFNLKPEFAWRRGYLECRVALAEGGATNALAISTNLITLANTADSGRLRAESHVLIASILEKLKRYDDAVATYEQNLSTNAPVDQQRISLLKITELSLAQNKISAGIGRLETFWTQFPKSPAADTVLLSLGELQLKQAISTRDVSTNLLDQAVNRFDTLLKEFSGSPLVGKALLDKGWSLWYADKIAASEQAFSTAAPRLAAPEDQAEARFKLADAQFMQGNFTNALENYSLLINKYAEVPTVKSNLLEQALYQTVRAALAATNLAAASDAVAKILDWYPAGFAGDRCLFLVAEGFAKNHQPAKARDLLSDFETRFGNVTNALLPQVRLAVARTYEQEQNWAAAITNYDAWIASFTKNSKLPEALFARAWATARAGQEAEALGMFTNFVARFRTNDLAPRAQWWVGDYYLRRGDSSKAEESYQFPAEWSRSELYLPAQMMAGRAAMARVLGYRDAITYFTNLANNASCPLDLRVQAMLAAGDAYVSRTETGATNRPADLEEAVRWFKSVPASSARAVAAWGALGNCYLELGNFEEAAKFYNDVIQSPIAIIGAQRQAKVGLGKIAEAKAAGKTGAERNALLKEALEDYLNAFWFERDLRPGEPNDFFWTQNAGWEAARLAETLDQWTQAVNVYRQIQTLPNLSAQFQATLEKRIARAREHLVAAKN